MLDGPEVRHRRSKISARSVSWAVSICASPTITASRSRRLRRRQRPRRSGGWCRSRPAPACYGAIPRELQRLPRHLEQGDLVRQFPVGVSNRPRRPVTVSAQLDVGDSRFLPPTSTCSRMLSIPNPLSSGCVKLSDSVDFTCGIVVADEVVRRRLRAVDPDRLLDASMST